MFKKSGFFSFFCFSCFITFIVSAPFGVSANEPNKSTEKETNSSSTGSAAEFDTGLLRQEGKNQIDVSRFTYGSNATPGKYRIDILVNDNLVSHEEVAFKEDEGHRVAPCLTPDMIKLINLNIEKIPFSNI